MIDGVVAKFGGTSMAQPEFVEDIVNTHPEQRIIVVSAPGKHQPEFSEGTTKLLQAYTREYSEDVDSVATKSSRDAIMGRFVPLFADLGSYEASAIGNHLYHDLRLRGNDADFIASRGEHYSALRAALRLGCRCVEAANVFLFDEFGNYQREASRPAIERLGQMAAVDRIVIGGYYGATAQGKIKLFGNGGSDRTGGNIAAVLEIPYQNWTDVDGIYAADPKLVPSAHVIDELTREEVREGAHGGTGVFQGDTIIDLDGSSVITTIRNTFNPHAAGTRIVTEREWDPDNPIVAVSGRSDIMEVTIRDMGMAQRDGYVAALFSKLSALGLGIDRFPSSGDSFSVTLLPNGDSQATAVEEFKDWASGRLLTKSGKVEVTEKGIVIAVGEGLRQSEVRTIALRRLLDTAIDIGVPVEDVVSNRLSPSLALLVDPVHVEPLIRSIHDSEIAEFSDGAV